MLSRMGVLIGALLALAGVGSATATTSAVSVHGSANVFYPDFPEPGSSVTERVVINGSVGPTGEPRGSILVISPFGFNIADVTCLAVVGDSVYVGGPLVPGFDVYRGDTFAQLAFGVTDGTPDLIASAIFRRSDVDTCDVLSAFPPVFSTSDGNLTVTAS